MKNNTQRMINYFKNQGGVVRFSSVLKAGFHPDSVTALVKEGKVEKIARGLYCLTDFEFASHPDLVTASLQAPKGVICLISALAFHEATNEIPRVVDLAIPRISRSYKITYPPVTFYRFAQEAWKAGIEKHEIEGYSIRVYSLAKTIADCFKFRNKIGVNVARDALKIAITEKGVKPKEIMQYAKICRVNNVMKPILEAML
ncbi:MAG: type IV toxin-antitoxin system AbiEi family antitoxin domain-containing protein [Nitrospirae bacterium]|nr:type IV toxin-antitoxin system AbiEi family antitoxin domain-containing protein [Nitrospirota bacterium]